MSRDPLRPSQPAGDNPAGRTRGSFYKAHVQSPHSTRDLMSTVDQSGPAAIVFLQSTGPSHALARTPSAAAAQYQLSVSTATVSVDHLRLAFGDADKSEHQTTIPQATTSVTFRDNFGTLSGNEAPDSPSGLHSFSPLHSPARESRKPRKFDQILTAKSDTLGSQKPSHGFCSDLSCGSIPLSGVPSRSESLDQGKRRVDALDIEMQRIKERIRKARIELITIQEEMYQSIANTNRACQAAKERVQAESEFAIRDIEVQMNVTNQRIAGMRTEMDQYQSQTHTHFQRNFPSQTSRLSRRRTLPDTPFTSSSLLPSSSRSANCYPNHQQYYLTSQVVRATLSSILPTRVQSFVKSNFSSTAGDTVCSHVPKSPSPTVLDTSAYSNHTKPTSFKHSRYGTDQPPSQSVTHDFDPRYCQNIPAPVSEYLFTGTSLNLPGLSVENGSLGRAINDPIVHGKSLNAERSAVAALPISRKYCYS